MSSAKCFKWDKSKILSSGNELKYFYTKSPSATQKKPSTIAIKYPCLFFTKQQNSKLVQIWGIYLEQM